MLLSGLPTLRPRRRGLLARLSGVQQFVLSFAVLILFGTLGLLVLPGLYVGPRLGLVDALFTATSAVCVTGLVVVDTATYFTRWGQGWILLLIQLGGLGFMTLAALLIQVVGRSSLALEEASIAGAALRQFDAARLFRAVVILTLSLEAVGALLLWLAWRGEFGAGDAAWHAVFQAISAFCNAGFSTFRDSLAGFRGVSLVLLTIMGLVVIGGIGFPVLVDLRHRVGGARRLAAHTRLALATTGVLLVGAAIAYGIFERDHTLAGMAAGPWALNAAFMAVTPRTAGFNTVDYGAIANPSLALTIGLMVIGGSPGSMAGGIKTTTAGLLVLLFVARLRGRRDVTIGGRTVPEDTVQRAVGVAVGALALLGVAIFLLMLVQPEGTTGNRQQFTALVFEAHSALGTVGLSMGATPALTAPGRLVITLLMFIGRVGPLAFAAAMVVPRARRVTRAAYQDVVVG